MSTTSSQRDECHQRVRCSRVDICSPSPHYSFRTGQWTAYNLVQRQKQEPAWREQSSAAYSKAPLPDSMNSWSSGLVWASPLLASASIAAWESVLVVPEGRVTQARLPAVALSGPDLAAPFD